MATQPLRDNSIDFMRGIAVLLVIMGHYLAGRVRLAIFVFHIPLFLMISGYLCRIDRNICSHLKHQIVKILPVYFECVAVMKIIDVFIGSNTSRITAGLLSYANPNMENALISLNTGIGPIWFLPAMIVATFISYILIKKFYKNSHLLMGFGLLVSVWGGYAVK